MCRSVNFLVSSILISLLTCIEGSINITSFYLFCIYSISLVNCHSSKISEYVDYHLQPIGLEIPSYIKDTSDFLCKLKPIPDVPENYDLLLQHLM